MAFAKPLKDIICREETSCQLSKCKCDVDLAEKLFENISQFNPNNVINDNYDFIDRCER